MNFLVTIVGTVKCYCIKNLLLKKLGIFSNAFVFQLHVATCMISLTE